MAVGVTGDFEALKRLVAKVRTLSGPGFQLALNKNLAEEARTQVLLGFEQSRDPYGKRWDAVSRGGKPLLDSGRLRNSYQTAATARRFVLRTNVKYAGTHQYGAKIKAKSPGKPLKFRVGGRAGRWVSKYDVTIPKRQMVPEDKLGNIWTGAFNKSAGSFLRGWMRR